MVHELQLKLRLVSAVADVDIFATLKPEGYGVKLLISELI